MPKTYQDLLTEAREMLQDTDSEPQRYSDEALIRVLNRGLTQLARIRPDAFYDLYANGDLNVPELVESAPDVDQTAWTAVFGIGMQFYAPLVTYVTGVAEIMDDEYTEDGRAVAMLTAFRNSVLGI